VCAMKFLTNSGVLFAGVPGTLKLEDLRKGQWLVTNEDEQYFIVERVYKRVGSPHITIKAQWFLSAPDDSGEFYATYWFKTFTSTKQLSQSLLLDVPVLPVAPCGGPWTRFELWDDSRHGLAAHVRWCNPLGLWHVQMAVFDQTYVLFDDRSIGADGQLKDGFMGNHREFYLNNYESMKGPGMPAEGDTPKPGIAAPGMPAEGDVPRPGIRARLRQSGSGDPPAFVKATKRKPSAPAKELPPPPMPKKQKKSAKSAKAATGCLDVEVVDEPEQVKARRLRPEISAEADPVELRRIYTRLQSAVPAIEKATASFNDAIRAFHPPSPPPAAPPQPQPPIDPNSLPDSVRGIWSSVAALAAQMPLPLHVSNGINLVASLWAFGGPLRTCSDPLTQRLMITLLQSAAKEAAAFYATAGAPGAPQQHAAAAPAAPAAPNAPGMKGAKK